MTNPHNDDKDAVAAVLAGDRQRFALLVRKYHRPLLHLAHSRLGHMDRAEDAVQDAFVCAFRSLTTYKPQYSFRTWLWTILLNQCRRHGTRWVRTMEKQVSSSSLGSLDQAPSVESAPDVAAMVRERTELLHRLLLQLPEVQADAIRLRFYGQLKYREIAETMGSSLGAAKQRVRVGLLSLSEKLRENDLIDSVFPEDAT